MKIELVIGGFCTIDGERAYISSSKMGRKYLHLESLHPIGAPAQKVGHRIAVGACTVIKYRVPLAECDLAIRSLHGERLR